MNMGNMDVWDYHMYRNMDTPDLWIELLKIDKAIAEYSLLSREENYELFDYEFQKSLDRQFLGYISKSLSLIDMLKQRPEGEIRRIRNIFVGRYNADSREIKNHICFLEKVLL